MCNPAVKFPSAGGVKRTANVVVAPGASVVAPGGVVTAKFAALAPSIVTAMPVSGAIPVVLDGERPEPSISQQLRVPECHGRCLSIS